MAHTPGPPERYTFSARISDQGDDWTDIEMRSDTEKYTVATVEDRFAPLFLALPDLLSAVEQFLVNADDRDEVIDPDTGEEYDDFKALRAAVRKAKRKPEEKPLTEAEARDWEECDRADKARKDRGLEGQ